MSKEQLFQLLPMPDDGLEQVLEYAATLSKAEAAEHFTNMLGDSPQVIEFISAFNARRAEPQSGQKPAASGRKQSQTADVDAVPKSQHGPKKKKAPIHTPPPRQVASFELAPGRVYNKKDQEEDYISGNKSGTAASSQSNAQNNRTAPAKAATPPPQPPKPPPSAAGTLVSDLGLPKPKAKSNPVSRTSTPGPSSARSQTATAKVTITGGTPMHGSSTALADLDQAIRSLEITTNSTHASNNPANAAARRCNCVATRHPLLEAAPNCLSCGKVVCIKEGLGPCTFCGEPLLSSAEVQSMIRELRAERARERQALDREAHKKAQATSAARRPFARPGLDTEDLTVAEAMALQHRDKLLGFQAQNARRTTVRDEAADFDATYAGGLWASAEERALALKRQQKLMREMEWNAKPEYEKRQQVLSIDVTGRKVLKRTIRMERPPMPEEDGDGGKGSHGGGAFSKNPLLGGLIRPVYDIKGKGTELEGRKDRGARWRRVQDDLDDNEAIILDGGLNGGTAEAEAGAAAAGDEPSCG
ncbi:hypothetical protein VTH06DRAFT_3130 [Thermothelomyces fergusii]